MKLQTSLEVKGFIFQPFLLKKLGNLSVMACFFEVIKDRNHQIRMIKEMDD